MKLENFRFVKYILALVITAAPCVASMSAKNLPSQHLAATNSLPQANPFFNDAMENARLNSPFALAAAEMAAEEADAANPLLSEITDYAAGFLGTRYRLGASGPSRFDCSGFTSYVFKKFGVALNRDSRSQFLQGEAVESSELRPGDLLFFSSRSSGRGRVGHVAMVVDVNPDGSCTFIHASTKKGVTYQRFPDGGYYQRNYLGAKRIIGAAGFRAS